MSAIAWHKQAAPHLELKTWPRLSPVSLSLSMVFHMHTLLLDCPFPSNQAKQSADI
jgi:hypothetical protein